MRLTPAQVLIKRLDNRGFSWLFRGSGECVEQVLSGQSILVIALNTIQTRA